MVQIRLCYVHRLDFFAYDLLEPSSLCSLACISTYLRYALPDPLPLPDPISTVKPTSPLYFSEALANTYIHHLADTIGYRIVGTEEMSETVEYVLDLLEGLKADAKKVGNTKEIEIWHQQDDGAHLFEFMGKVSQLYSTCLIIGHLFGWRNLPCI